MRKNDYNRITNLASWQSNSLGRARLQIELTKLHAHGLTATQTADKLGIPVQHVLSVFQSLL